MDRIRLRWATYNKSLFGLLRDSIPKLLQHSRFSGLDIDMSLHIIIVGAGIAGLSAAIALARQKHQVRIFETSSFSKKVGAALNVAAPAVKILKSWGMDLAQLQPNTCHRWELYKSSPTDTDPAQIMMVSPLGANVHNSTLSDDLELGRTRFEIGCGGEDARCTSS